jgi:hypothetical protein
MPRCWSSVETRETHSSTWLCDPVVSCESCAGRREKLSAVRAKVGGISLEWHECDVQEDERIDEPLITQRWNLAWIVECLMVPTLPLWVDEQIL